MRAVVLTVLLLVTLLVPAVALYRVFRARRAFGTAAEQATFDVLHKANEAAPPLRAGMTRAAAAKAIKNIHNLLGSRAVALTDETDLLAWEGPDDHHAPQAAALAAAVVGGGRARVVTAEDLICKDPYCTIRAPGIVSIVVR